MAAYEADVQAEQEAGPLAGAGADVADSVRTWDGLGQRVLNDL